MTLRRILTSLFGLALAATTITALAPAASAHIVAPPDGGDSVPAPPLPVPNSSGLPTWAIVAIVVGTIMVAAATTLVTLAVARTRQPRPFQTTPGTAQPHTVELDPAAETLQAR